MAGALVELRAARVAHGPKTILDQVDLSLAPGELAFLVGRVGSGKTSLLKSLYAELPLRAEAARVAGYDLLRLRTRQVPWLRRKLGIVFQDFRLLPDRSVRDNLALVLEATGWHRPEERQARVLQVLERVGLPHKLDAMPHQLSGGEQQRVAVARALLNSPPLILADEPTGNLDPESAQQVLAIFQQARRLGTAVIMATHNHQIVRQFEAKVFRCHDGRLEHLPRADEIDFDALGQ